MFVVMIWWRRSLTSSLTSPRRAEESTDPCSLLINMVSLSSLTVHPLLSQFPGHIMEEVKSDSEVQAQYIARNPVSRVIQCAAVQSENEVRRFYKLWSHVEKLEPLDGGGDSILILFLFKGEHNPSWLHLTRNESFRRRMAESNPGDAEIKCVIS